MNNNISPSLIGSELLKRGFRDWFLYLFRIINGTPFVREPMHEKLFEQFGNVINGTDTRISINLPPRSAKTTLSIYLCIWAFLQNPKSQIIYTSFNQNLLKQISAQMASIMKHPAFRALYPTLFMNTGMVDDKAIDEYWANHIQAETGKPTFSSVKITTPQGGIILFSALGAALTGFGASVRNAPGFSGMILIDDANQPSQVRSAVIREKTQTYFSETLLSRLNNPGAPIINVQQRVHLEDLTAYLRDTYGFKTFTHPLIDDDGNCTLPSQYPPERLKEIQANNYVFQAQYQQNPIMLGGGVFKTDWIRYYNDLRDCSYRRIFITADTACKTNEWNDYTAIGVWGVTNQNRLRLLDFVHAKFEIPELLQVFQNLWGRWRNGIGSCRCSAVYIEDKASGTQIIQTLRRRGGLPILSVRPQKDKLTRALEIVPQLAAGNLELPENANNALSKEFLIDYEAFSANMSQKNDDSVDCLIYAIDAAFNRRGYF